MSRATVRGRRFSIEFLEARQLLAAVSVDPSHAIRAVNTKLLGTNIATWDGNLVTSLTMQKVSAAGLTGFRFPGGSTSDNYHFAVNNSQGVQGLGAMANFIASAGGVGIATVNYGTGSPQESAAMLAYLNGSTTSTVTIGAGEQWNGSSWVSVDWKTVGYWASLRAASKLGTDDGLNFLRISRSSPFATHYWEIGNEVYGSWETDQHGSTGDALPMPSGATRKAHDPTTYISFCKQFATLAAQIDPTISIGIGSQTTDSQFSNWITNLLTQCASQSFTPGFIADHLYTQQPGQESDSVLLAAPSTIVTPTPANPMDWVQRAQSYRSLITSKLGAAGSAVELLATEFNSVSSNPGKQMCSMVNGLFVADSLGSLMQTEYNGAWVWDLHNSYGTGGNASSSLYGWRAGGDYGMLGTSGTAPTTGNNIAYPNYFAMQLASKFAQAGGTVVQATSDSTSLDVYSVLQSNGHLSLLVINKSSAGLNNDTSGTPQSITANFNLGSYVPASAAQLWQYGTAEDNAQKNSGNGSAALTTSSPTLSVSGSTFSYAFPSYSMTVIDLTPVAPQVASSAYPYATRADAVQFSFNSDVSASLSPSDLVVTNLDGGAVPVVDSVQWNAATRTASFILSPSIPADGNYRATLLGSGVTNIAGVALASNSVLDFFTLAGDANHDRVVDVTDLGILATNWQGTGKTFAQGDFNYSGTVDVTDLGILATNWQKTLPPPASRPLAQQRFATVASMSVAASPFKRRSDASLGLLDTTPGLI